MLLAVVPAIPAHAAGVRVPCNVAALQTAVTNANTSGGAIKLASHCIYAVKTPATASDAFPIIVKPVTIVGGRSSIIRRDLFASTSFRVFEVAAGGVLTLKSLAVENGLSVGGGGAVSVTSGGEIVAKHVAFNDNGAANGGGVSIGAAGRGVIRSSTFFGNSTSSAGGGAIVDFGALVLKDSSLLNNTAPINGGGLNVQPGATASMVRTRVERNRSGAAGGGVSDVMGAVRIASSKITSNVSGASGGGIASSGTGLVHLRSTVVKHNSPNNCNPAIKGCRH